MIHQIHKQSEHHANRYDKLYRLLSVGTIFLLVSIISFGIGQEQDNLRNRKSDAFHLAISSKTVHTNNDIVVDFWKDRPERSVAPGDEETGRQKWRNAIWNNQHPKDCSKVKLCTCRSASGQSFSTLHGRTYCLIHAVLNKCTLVESATDYFGRYKKRCDSTSGFECFFKKISKCDTKKFKGKHFENVKQFNVPQICYPIFSGFQEQIKQKHGLASGLLVMSEAISYLMRPNQEFEQKVRETIKSFGIGGRNELQRTLGVHIRHGDKRSTAKEEKLHTRFAARADWVRRSFGYDQIYVMTDDIKVAPVMKRIEKLNKGVSVFEMGNSMKGEIFPVILFTQVVIAANSGMLLGSALSNVDRAIIELAATVKYPPQFIDAAGDTYAPCPLKERHTPFDLMSPPYWNTTADNSYYTNFDLYQVFNEVVIKRRKGE